MVTGGVSSTTMGSSNPVVAAGLVGNNGASGAGPGGAMPVESVPSVGRRSSENRRSNKPIMEKRRRARINNCLNELKSLILDAMKKDPARHSKLEKADILEMTVKHLESLQRQQMAMVVAADPGVLNKYRAGFNECTTEVGRFLGRGDAPQLDPHLKRRLLAHLSNCLNGVGSPSSPPPSSPAPAPAEATTPVQVQLPAGITMSTDGQLQASHNVLGSLQLVPTRLPNGDIALVLPSHHSAAHMFRTAAAPVSPSPSSSSSSASSTASQSPPPPPLAPFSGRGPVCAPPASSPSPLGFSLSMHSGSLSPSSTGSSSSGHLDVRALSPPMQKPLSLVTRRTSSSASSAAEDDEGKPCWRPWSMA